MGDVDLALRHVTTRHPEDLARRFVREGEPIVSMRWLDTQAASRERRMDKGLLVQLRSYRLVIHTEWFIDDAPETAWRMYDYGHDLLATVRAEDAARYEAERERAKQSPDASAPMKPDPVYLRSFAVMLDGPIGPQPSVGEWRTSEPGTPTEFESVIRYRIDAVYQRTTAELVANPGVLWLVFAPLARDVSEDNLRLAIQAAKERMTSREELDDLASAMHVIATARPREHNLSQRILDMFKEEGLIERTWLFQQGIEKGIEQGVEKGAREVLLSLLAARGIKLSTTQRQKIDETHDLEVLQRWAVRAATATTAAAVFTERAKKASRSPKRA